VKRETKETRIQEVSEIFKANQTLYVFDYKNMTVAQSVDLRKTLRKNNSSLKIVKNRLALRALRAEFPAEFKSSFRDPTAVAYTAADPIALARLLKDFAARNKVLAMKGGLVEGHYFPAERFDEIVKLGSRQQLLGKVGYLMAFPLMQLLRTWQAPLTNVGSLLSQLKNKN
jgi:large subunit ribosomal protein L10